MTDPEADTRNETAATPDAKPGEAAGQSTKPARKTRPPRAVIKNLDDFLAVAYGANGRAVAVDRAVASALVADPNLSPDGRARLDRWAQEDLRLAVAVQLLIVVRQLADRPRPRAALREVVRSVLMQHPAVCGEPRLLEVLTGLERNPDAATLLGIAAKLDMRAALGKSLGSKVTQKLATDASSNLVWCLTLWLAETSADSPEALIRVLYDVDWVSAGERIKGEARRWRVLTRRTPSASLGIVGSAFSELVRVQGSQLDALRRDGSLATDRLRASEEHAEAARTELENQKAIVAAISTQLAQLQQTHREKLAHARDDHERLRARVLRRLRSESRLLHEGLLALRRDPPKTIVMDDHAERVLSGLEAEIRHIETETEK